MLCCVVLLAFVGLVLRRRQVIDPFPPPARRSATGAPLASSAAYEAPSLLRPPPAAQAIVLRWLAIGVLVYVVAITVMVAVGAAQVMDGSNLHWFLRDLLFAVMAAAALVWAAREATGGKPARSRPAFALIGAGVAWAVLGIVDMHVLMLFEIAHGQLLWDTVFHGAGFWVVTGGLVLLHRCSANGTTVTSAQ